MDKSVLRIRVGELDYTNTLPFRLPAAWAPLPCPSPRLLAQWADDEKIDAGVLPVVEAWRLEDRFEPLGSFGIAVKRKAGSVLLFSNRPWTQLNGATIGVTDQTATSVRLLKVLMEEREGFSVTLGQGFHANDQARLLIGDDALKPAKDLLRDFPHIYDLGEQWHAWHGGPFVFARWMVRRTVPRYLREELADVLDSALTTFDRNREHVALRAAKNLKLPLQQMIGYFNGLIYRLESVENQSESLFRDLVTGRRKRVCC
jgi:chorismate dehydratase